MQKIYTILATMSIGSLFLIIFLISHK